MVGTRKRKDFVEDFGSELFDNLEEMIEALLEDMGDSVPFVYGFSIIHLPGEAPELREFGNVPEHSEDEENLFTSEIRDPLIDIFESEELVHVLAELPEIEKEDLLLSCDCSKSRNQDHWGFRIFAGHRASGSCRS